MAGIPTQTIFAARMKKMREKGGMTQVDLARELSMLITGNTTEVSPLTISSYERGARLPVVPTLLQMSKLFNCSIDYLLGASENAEMKSISEIASSQSEDGCPLPEHDFKLDWKMWAAYHGQPVWVVFENGLYESRWAILDWNNRKLHFMDGSIDTDTQNITLYRFSEPTQEPILGRKYRPLTICPLMQTTDRVWVEMITNDRYIKGRYNGWYRHNEDHTALIGINTALTLPYEGLGIGYNAYLINERV